MRKLLFLLLIASPLRAQVSKPPIEPHNINNVLNVDGIRYLTIDAAIAALRVGGGIVIIPSNYAGAESAGCTVNGLDGFSTWSGAAAVTVVDLRLSSACMYSVAYNSSLFGLTPFAATKVFPSPSTTASAGIFTSKYGGALAAGGGNLNGVTAEVDVTGAITSNPTATVPALLAEAHVRGTGGTIPDLAGIATFNGIDRTATTTNITRAYGVFVNACGNTSTSGATIANCYGFYTNHNTLGISSNYSFFSNGRIRLAYFASDNGLDLESTGGTATNILKNDGTDTLMIIGLSAAKGIKFGSPITPNSVTVSSLPAAAAGNAGQIMIVSDSTTVATEGQTCVGSSSNTALAFSNGSVWKCF